MGTSLPLHLTSWHRLVSVFFFFLAEHWTEASRDALLVKRQLQGDLYKRVGAHPQFLDVLLPVAFEDKDFHVQVVHQPTVQRGQTGTSGLL